MTAERDRETAQGYARKRQSQTPRQSQGLITHRQKVARKWERKLLGQECLKS